MQTTQYKETDVFGTTNYNLPIPNAGKTLQWVIENPNAVRDAMRFLNLVISLEVQVTQASGLANPKRGIVFAGRNAVLPIPLQLRAPIADSTATAASVSAQLNLLLAALRSTGQLPT